MTSAKTASPATPIRSAKKNELSDLNSPAFPETSLPSGAHSFREKIELSDLNSPAFHENDLTQAAHSFREENTLSDLNSSVSQEDSFSSDLDSLRFFLTFRQFQVIGSLLPSPNPEDLGIAKHPEAKRRVGRRRGRPPADPRPLLDAIFWKTAHHARWQDLLDLAPLSQSEGLGEGMGVRLLTCRRYYRRLFLSGRLFTLYTALYHDLRTRGQTDLASLVNQGCFTISGNALSLSPGLPDTWQLRTALLFMQYAWQVSRHILRKKDQAQRRNPPSLRWKSYFK